MNPRSPVQQWQQPWQPTVTPTQSNQSYPNSPRPRHSQKHDVQQSSPSRGRSRQQFITNTAIANSISGSKSQSNTPRRKGNPQSPRIKSKAVDSLEIAKSRSRSHSSVRMLPESSVDLATPLSALSTLLTTSQNYHLCAIKNYRVNHQLFRDAKDRTAKGEFV